MGLNAVVYRNRAHLDLGQDSKAAIVDMETGEVYFEDGRTAREIERHAVKAAEFHIGNVAEVNALRAEIMWLIGPVSRILVKILYSGSHSGDLIPANGLPELSSEVQRIE